MTTEIERPNPLWESMVGMAVTQQSPVPLREAIQIQSKGDKDADEEVVPDEAVTKNVVEVVDASTAQHIHHQSETLREK